MPTHTTSADASFPYAVTGLPCCGRAITPSDTVDLTSLNGSRVVPMHVVVYGAGNIVVIPAGNTDAQTLTFAVSADAAGMGFVVPVLVRRVMNTSTTATSIFGFY